MSRSSGSHIDLTTKFSVYEINDATICLSNGRQIDLFLVYRIPSDYYFDLNDPGFFYHLNISSINIHKYQCDSNPEELMSSKSSQFVEYVGFELFDVNTRDDSCISGYHVHFQYPIHLKYHAAMASQNERNTAKLNFPDVYVRESIIERQQSKKFCEESHLGTSFQININSSLYSGYVRIKAADASDVHILLDIMNGDMSQHILVTVMTLVVLISSAAAILYNICDIIRRKNVE